jgi:hypothetical protein
MHTLDVRAAAHALGGDISGRDGVVCPGPGHSRQDRSLSVKFDANAPGGFVTHSFANDDPIACRDHVREGWALRRLSRTVDKMAPRSLPTLMAAWLQPTSTRSRVGRLFIECAA